MNITITTYDENSDETETVLPAKYEVCSCCRGKGTTVDPNIDGNGITASEWDEMCYDDPEFPDNYKNGMYDVTCEECNGLRVVSVVDENLLSPEQKEIYETWHKQEYSRACSEAEDRRTRRMESGGYDY